MKPRYFPLLAILATVAGLMLWLRHGSLPAVQHGSVSSDEVIAEDLPPLDYSKCEDLIELDSLDQDLPPIDEFADKQVEELSAVDYVVDSAGFDHVSPGEMRLSWIAAQQYPDGGWVACLPTAERNLTPRVGRNGATGLALLCLLETGHTHKEKSRYQKQISAGLQYLIEHLDGKNPDSTKELYSFEDSEGKMVSHAIATLALCEAYGLTKDKALLPYVQGALNSIVQRQHENGGWGVDRMTAPDLVTTGWIVMCFERGVLSYLKVEPSAIKAAKAFVERSKPTPENRLRPLELAMWGKATILFGATRETPGMTGCICELDALGFSRTDCAYNFVANSVMRRWDDDTRRRWRDALIKLDDEVRSSSGAFQETWPPYEPPGKHDFWNSRLERTCLMYLARHLELRDKWHHYLKDRPDPPQDGSFPL